MSKSNKQQSNTKRNNLFDEGDSHHIYKKIKSYGIKKNNKTLDNILKTKDLKRILNYGE